MIKDIHFPLEMPGPDLDNYLAQGWFRMAQSIFTTDFIPVEGQTIAVYWLRFPVQQVRFGNKQRRLQKINRDLAITVKPFRLSHQLEELYSCYRSQVDFDAPPSIESFLYDTASYNIYDTWILEGKLNGKTIAAGIFDVGTKAVAGIMNFFDPAFKARSLGKFLMLAKIEYAGTTGKDFYYPGYIASGFTKFDYKLFPDPAVAEIFDPVNEKWIGLKNGWQLP